MATELAKAYVQIVPSAKGIKGSIGTSLNGEADSAGTSSGHTFGGKMIGAIKGLIVAAGIGKALSASIMEGAALQQSIGGIETLFKGSSDKVKQYAAEAYKTTGLSANAYMESVTGFSASLLQGLGGDTDKAAEIANTAMVDMSDNANKMGTDMGLIQNAYQGFAKQNYTMLDNLKLGYGGTKEEMQRLLTDAQKVTGVKYDMSNLSDVYSAIHVIQGELDITGTTAKEASSTISGSFASMKAAFKNVLGQLALGQDIAPALGQLLDTVNVFLADNLMPAVGSIFASLPEVLDYAITGAVRSLNLVTASAPALVDQGIKLVLKLVNSIVTGLPYILDCAANLIGALASALLDYDWASTGQEFISQLQSSLDIAAGEILGTDGNIVGSMIAAIQANFPRVLRGGMEILNGIVSGIMAAIPMVFQAVLTITTTLVNTFVENYPQYIRSGTEILLTVIDGIRNALPQMLVAAGDAIISMATGLINNLPQIIAAGFEMISKLIIGIGNALPDIASAAGKVARKLLDTILEVDWLDLGCNIIRGLIDGIGLMAGALWDAATNIAKSAFDAICSFFGIASPSKLMRDEVGRWIPAGIAVGIEGNTRPISDAMRSLTALTTGTLQTDVALGLRYSQPTGIPALAYAGGYGGTTNFYQTINSHEALSPAEMTRETENLFARRRWKNP